MKTNKSTCRKLLLAAISISLFNIGVFAKEKSPDGNSTLENLMTSYNGESNAHARYISFAQKADEEGYKEAASLFRATARAEQVHIKNDANVAKELGTTLNANIETPEVKSTRENLEAAIKGETYESKEMYPAFEKRAKKDGIKSAKTEFGLAKEAEAVHAKLYKEQLDNIEKGKTELKQFYVCPRCGNIVDKKGKGFCPICGEPLANFIPVS
ncbi:MAG: ferritin family protein [Phycisphaerales bacterium]